jgi:hypothetical protein
MKTTLVGLACVCFLSLSACEDDAPQLSSGHPGWQNADCASCHNLADEHGGDRTWDMCFGCHGGNGQPARPAGHHDQGCIDCHSTGGAGPWNATSHSNYADWDAAGCLGCHDPG